MVKNTIRLGIILFLLIIPMGMPDDIIIVPAIIAAIGLEAYILLTVAVSIYLYNTTQGDTLADKLRTARKELKQIFG